MPPQVAAQPKLHGVVQQLMSTSEGCELYVRPPATYGITLGGYSHG